MHNPACGSAYLHVPRRVLSWRLCREVLLLAPWRALRPSVVGFPFSVFGFQFKWELWASLFGKILASLQCKPWESFIF
jgi:hypothetical protein